MAKGHIHLQETLADDVLALMLAHPRVRAARVSTAKPDVYPDCDAVGVEVFGLKDGCDHERRHRTPRPLRKKPAFEANKLSKRLHRQVGQAIADFNMIEAGDKVMVCVSGGKDSYALLDILLSLRERAPVPFDLVAVNLDQKQPGFPEHVLPEYLAARGVPFHIENAGHLLDRQAPGARGPDDVQPVLAPAPRHPVPRGRRARRDQDRARPPPRRHGASRC